MIFDTHAHLCSESFTDEEIPLVMQRAKEAGVEMIVNIATSPDELKRAIKQKKEYPQLLLAGATTPADVDLDEEWFSSFEKAAENHELVAIGETGLDYTYNSDKELQKKSFIRYLELAKRVSLPVIIHCREAFSDLFLLLEKHYSREGKLLPGVLHCFTGNEEEAFYLVKQEWFLSCSGILTFKKSETLRRIFQKIPVDRIVMETDAPYLAPTPFRSKKNEPSYIVETAKLLADLKQISFEELIMQLNKNAKALFS